MLRIGLIDADRLDNKTRHPNLALMKISQYCKRQGNIVDLLFRESDIESIHEYDLLVISKVFTFTSLPPTVRTLIGTKSNNLKDLNKSIVQLLENYSEKKPGSLAVAIGGTGFFDDGGRDLDDEIEHIMPDYSLYSEFVDWMVNDKKLNREYFDDYENYSLGFTTRGCFRKCPFCVNKKYDKCHYHAHVSEFLDETRSKIYLWDDNILACSNWKSIFDELDGTGKPFQFRQGLDMRLMTEEKAERISRSRYYGDTIFALDNVDECDFIENKLKIWRKYSKRTTKFYILCGFDSWIDPSRVIKSNQKHLQKMYSISDQDERDQLDIEGVFIRISVLMRYGCLPYIMRHQYYQNSKYKGLYTQLARWCNQPQFFKKKSFAEFCRANQEYSKSDKNCASYQAYLDFKKVRPDIAERFFDMRYDEMIATRTISSFGRLNETTPCLFCKNPGMLDKDLVSERKTTIDYYSGRLDQLCIFCRPIVPVDGQCRISEHQLGEHLYKTLSNAEYSVVLEGIDESQDFILTSVIIPQLNDYRDAYQEVLNIICMDNNSTYKSIGELCSKCLAESPGSRTKYGECQVKLLMMADLVWKDRNGFNLTPLGKVFVDLSSSERDIFFNKLILKIPFIQKMLKQAGNGTRVCISDWLSDCLAEKTVIRRARPIKNMLNNLRGLDKELDRRLELIDL